MEELFKDYRTLVEEADFLDEPIATVVNLGNHGYDLSLPFAESLRLARYHPSWEVIGIDVVDGKHDPLPNFTQIKAEFIEGINSIGGLVNRITAYLSLGYYDDMEIQHVSEAKEIDPKDGQYSKLVDYTADVLSACYDKLINRGSLVAVVSRNGKAIIKEALENSYFKTSEMEFKEIDPKNYATTHWMRVFHERDNLPLYRLRLKKS